MSAVAILDGRFEVRRVTRDSDAVVKLRCPSCRVWADLDADQWNGRVSVECECGRFHETHDFSAMTASAP
ncbi:MAG: hypothetical protein AAB368_11175 [bacterium]